MSLSLTLFNQNYKTILSCARESVLTPLYETLFLAPLRNVYIRGFWAGVPMEDICAHLTKHSSRFWIEHEGACAAIIERNFDSWVVYAHFVLYIAFWVVLIRILFSRLCSVPSK